MYFYTQRKFSVFILIEKPVLLNIYTAILYNVSMWVKSIYRAYTYMYINILGIYNSIYYMREERHGERDRDRYNHNSFKHLYPAFQFIKVVKTFQLTRRFNEVYFLENYFTSQFESIYIYSLHIIIISNCRQQVRYWT